MLELSPARGLGLLAAASICLSAAAAAANGGRAEVDAGAVQPADPGAGRTVRILDPDIAQILRLERSPSLVVVGNPAIADATLADERSLVLTGKTVGTTNLIVLDEAGQQIAHVLLRVSSPRGAQVRVYNGLQQQTFACEPACVPVEPPEEPERAAATP